MSQVPSNYYSIISGLKERIRQARLKAVVLINKELLQVYWEIGQTILDQQKEQGWGAKIIDQLSADLKNEFPDFKGLSVRNLKYMRAFAEAYPQFGLVQQPAAQIQIIDKQPSIIVQQLAAQLPWGHHQVLLDKIKSPEQRLYYMQKAIENGWSRDVMIHQIETSSYERSGKAITNFNVTLPALQSDLAQQSIKNPYVFDFLSYSEEMKERELEKALIQHLKNFMLELGKGFAWIGNQKNLVVEEDDFFLDLLFFNYNMNCFVIFELKIGEFKPEFAGKLNFYVNAIDEQLKGKEHNPTIGILLCKTPNQTVIKYSLQGIESPIGVTSYQFEKALPKELKGELPTVEELEKEIDQGYAELKNPVDKKIDRLKDMLKNLKEPEIKEKRNIEHCRNIYQKVVMVLLAKMLNRFEKDLTTMFQDNEATIYIDGQSFTDFDKAGDHMRDNLGSPCKEFKIEFRSNGFKKAGTNTFNLWSGLQLLLQDYKYSFSPVNELQVIFLEKLYHESLTVPEENELVEKWMDRLLDNITFHVEKISPKQE
jgi:predicted nuclease of restriction endonuclease-like (RecB) superfamily